MISQDQAEGCADALLHVARAESDARLERRRGVHRYPDLTAWRGRAAVWREALAATRWQWPVLLAAFMVIVPNLALLVIAALSLAHARAATTPYFLGYLTPLGLIAIQRVHWRCARRYLRLRGHREAIDRASSAGL